MAKIKMAVANDICVYKYFGGSARRVHSILLYPAAMQSLYAPAAATTLQISVTFSRGS